MPHSELRSAVDPANNTPTFEGRLLHHPGEPVFDQGLPFDVETLISRRGALKVFGTVGLGVGMFTLAACSPAASALLSAAPSSSPAAGSTGAECAPIPPETAGPFPGDGSNGPDILNQSGVVRSDIRSSFGSSTRTAEGVPLTIRLTILDLAKGCAPFAGAAVYVWHCDRDGNYSMYSQAAAAETYLRGVGETDDQGVVTFESIFPACYPGRWPHVHFEVYPSLAKATNPRNVIGTSQVALPAGICTAVYATTGYESSVGALARVSLATDNVFRDDGGVRELGAISGSISSGLTVDLPVPVQGA